MPINRSPTVTLKCGGAIHSGWTSIEVTRSIETLAGSFQARLTDLDPARGIIVSIPPGAPCEIMVDGETILTGYTDDAGVQYDAERHEVTIGGRDVTGDLVDCAAWVPGKGASIWNTTVAPLSIITAICKPFKIGVKAEVDIKTMPQFAITPGETAWAAIDKICRTAGVLPMSDGLGRLVLTRGGAGGSFSRLEEGDNIKVAHGAYSAKDRFSDYYVVGQLAGDDVQDSAVPVMGHATDPLITRWRPMVIQGELFDGNGSTGNRRAQWEASVRAGRALRYVVTAQGWRDDAGNIWEPNGLVPLRSAMIGIDETLIISTVHSVFDDQGSRTELTVTRPDAFKLIPLEQAPMFLPGEIGP